MKGACEMKLVVDEVDSSLLGTASLSIPPVLSVFGRSAIPNFGKMRFDGMFYLDKGNLFRYKQKADELRAGNLRTKRNRKLIYGKDFTLEERRFAQAADIATDCGVAEIWANPSFSAMLEGSAKDRSKVINLCRCALFDASVEDPEVDSRMISVRWLIGYFERFISCYAEVYFSVIKLHCQKEGVKDEDFEKMFRHAMPHLYMDIDYLAQLYQVKVNSDPEFLRAAYTKQKDRLADLNLIALMGRYSKESSFWGLGGFFNTYVTESSAVSVMMNKLQLHVCPRCFIIKQAKSDKPGPLKLLFNAKTRLSPQSSNGYELIYDKHGYNGFVPDTHHNWMFESICNHLHTTVYHDLNEGKIVDDVDKIVIEIFRSQVFYHAMNVSCAGPRAIVFAFRDCPLIIPRKDISGQLKHVSFGNNVLSISKALPCIPNVDLKGELKRKMQKVDSARFDITENTLVPLAYLLAKTPLGFAMAEEGVKAEYTLLEYDRIGKRYGYKSSTCTHEYIACALGEKA